jgi:hypothetical protein
VTLFVLAQVQSEYLLSQLQSKIMMTKHLICSLLTLVGLAGALSSCGTLVDYKTAKRSADAYHKEVWALDKLSTNYGELVDSREAREDWLASARTTPGLERLVSAWAFRESEDIDTGRPSVSKAVVKPGVAWTLPQVRQQIDGLGWGTSGDLVSVKKPGKDGYLIAFFR